MSDDLALAYMNLENAVRIYLSHLAAYEQGAENLGRYVDNWRAELERLTGGHDE